MAGHSKWAQIKRKKGVTDAAKSRVFSRFARLISLEAKKCMGDMNAPSLLAVISRAKAVNMPKDNIERAVAKGMSRDSSELEQVLYEAYGPGGVAIIIDALTDNRNRTTQEIKHLLSKNGIALAAPGAALWAFTNPSTSGPEGIFIPREPLIEIGGEDEEKLSTLLSAIDEHEDVQTAFTNARGYETTSDGI